MKSQTRVRAKRHIIRKQNYIYFGLIFSGAALIILSLIDRDLFAHWDLFANGVAFLIVGCVGVLMSWTTSDVGASLKEAVVEDGDKTRAKLDSINGSIIDMKDSVNGSITEMNGSITEMNGSINNMKDSVNGSINEVKDSITEMNGSINEVKDSITEMTDSLKDSIDSLTRAIYLTHNIKDTTSI